MILNKPRGSDFRILYTLSGIGRNELYSPRPKKMVLVHMDGELQRNLCSYFCPT